MKKFEKKLSLFLALIMVLSFVPFLETKVKADDVTLSVFNTKLEQFKSSKYANGSTYKDNPLWAGGYQCFGFANELAVYIFGSYPTSSTEANTVKSGWSVTYGGNAVDNLCVGDIVRFFYHSIFITKIDGDTIYYCQANAPGGTNRVTYDNKTTRGELKTKVSKKLTSPNTDKTGWVAHFEASKIKSTNILTINYHANGGAIDSTIIGNIYAVSESDGLNMRSGPGTGYSKITAFTKGTTFTVNVGDTQSDGTYTWGKTTCGGYTGWVVISDFVTHKGYVRDSSFYLNSSYVYSSSSSSKLIEKYECGVSQVNGLADNDYLGLYRNNYNFLGWSLSQDGSTTIFPDSTSISAETIYPEIKNGNAEITLYAVWKEIHIHTPGAAATCTSNQTCTTCGTVLANAKGHTPGAAATCTSNQTCTICGDILKPILEHSYSADQYVSQKHPHTIYYVCECGAIKDSGLKGTVSNCGECIVGIQLKDGSKYQVENEFLCGVKDDTNVKALLDSFKNNDLYVLNPNGKKLSDSDVCSTGCVIYCNSNDEKLTVVILGDVDGNGKVDSTDYLRIKGVFIGTYVLDTISTKAADIDKTGIVDSTDYLRVKSYFLGTLNIFS